MALWRPGGYSEDRRTRLADDAPTPAEGAVIVSLRRWLAERETLCARKEPIGVAVEAGADAQAHLVELADRPLIALAFAKFADGRAFSYARLLRDRYGFKGELRATGDVLIDEIPFMLRCGFTTFEATDAPTIRALETGRLPGPAIHYQPASAPGEAQAGGRPWLWVDRSPATHQCPAKPRASQSGPATRLRADLRSDDHGETG